MPPAAVACVTGCDLHFVLSIILVFLGFVPAVIHAIVIIVIYGYEEKELPRDRRRKRLRVAIDRDLNAYR